MKERSTSAPGAGLLALPSAMRERVPLRTVIRVCRGSAKPVSVIAGVEKACSKRRVTP
jgi:hypothetical protein